MTYKTNEIPEIVAGQAVLNKAQKLIDGIEILNAFYFEDRDYHLELSSNFDTSNPMYDISLATNDDLYSFSVYGLNDLNETYELLEFTADLFKDENNREFMLDEFYTNAKQRKD